MKNEANANLAKGVAIMWPESEIPSIMHWMENVHY